MFSSEKIFSNWSISGLIIILLTNLLLAQWQQQNKTITQATLFSSKSKPINISPTIDIQSLSLLKVPKKTPIVPAIAGTKKPSQTSPNVSVVKPKLSNTLLQPTVKVDPSPLAQKKNPAKVETKEH